MLQLTKPACICDKTLEQHVDDLADRVETWNTIILLVQNASVPERTEEHGIGRYRSRCRASCTVGKLNGPFVSTWDAVVRRRREAFYRGHLKLDGRARTETVIGVQKDRSSCSRVRAHAESRLFEAFDSCRRHRRPKGPIVPLTYTYTYRKQDRRDKLSQTLTNAPK